MMNGKILNDIMIEETSLIFFIALLSFKTSTNCKPFERIHYYSNNSYFISGFGARNIYLSCITSIITMYIYFNYFKAFNTCTYIYNTFYFIHTMHCVIYNVLFTFIDA